MASILNSSSSTAYTPSAATAPKTGSMKFTSMKSGNWWEALLPIVGNVASAYLGSQSANKQADAANKMSDAQIDLARQIYNQNLAMSRPFYQGSGNAFNMLSNIYGLPAQNFNAPFSGATGNIGGAAPGYGGFVPSAENNWGAGQSVIGHSGGGGPNATAQAIGSAAGSFIPVIGPFLGSAIGSAIGGMFRNGGDNWKTLATGAPQGFDYAAYMQAPDLQAEWSKKDVQSLFGGNKDAYAYWHFNKFGKNEGRQLNPVTGYEVGSDGLPTASMDSPTGSSASSTDSASSAASESSPTSKGMPDPMQAFWDSPYGKIATDQFLTLDNPAVKNAFATQGKMYSGAQQQALADRGRAGAQNAFGNYVNGLSNMAGFGPSASQDSQNAGNNMYNGVSNAFQAMGKTNADASAAKNNSWAKVLNGFNGWLQNQ